MMRYFQIKPGNETYDELMDFQNRRLEANDLASKFVTRLFRENNINHKEVNLVAYGDTLAGFSWKSKEPLIPFFRFDSKEKCWVPNAKTKEGKALKKEMQSFRSPSVIEVAQILFGRLMLIGNILHTPNIEFPEGIDDTIIVALDSNYGDVVPNNSTPITEEEYHLLMAKRKAA